MAVLDVHEQASRFGFRLDEVEEDGRTLWKWRRGSDERWPAFLTERAALEWMQDHISRARG